MVVLFGTVRTFKVTYTLFTLPYSHLCASSVSGFGSPKALITNGQFSFNLEFPATTVVTGTFATATTLNGNHTSMNLGTFSCSFLDSGDPLLSAEQSDVHERQRPGLAL